VQLDGRRGGAHLVLHRRLEAQQLLDCDRGPLRLRREQRALLGVLGQRDERVADEVGDRLGAGDVEQQAQAGDLLGTQRAASLGGDDVGEQVVAGGAPPALDVVGEVRAQSVGGGAGLRGKPVGAGLAGDRRAQPGAQGRLVLERQAEQAGDRAHRDRPRERRGGIEATGPQASLQRGAHVGADRRLRRGDRGRREALADDAPQPVVARRIRGDEVPRPSERQRVVEVHALRARPGPPLPRGALHVVEPAQRPEAPLLVAVDGEVAPQRAIRRVGLLLDERVVGDRHRDIESPNLSGGQARS
jgi:hypothetical protein